MFLHNGYQTAAKKCCVPEHRESLNDWYVYKHDCKLGTYSACLFGLFLCVPAISVREVFLCRTGNICIGASLKSKINSITTTVTERGLGLSSCWSAINAPHRCRSNSVDHHETAAGHRRGRAVEKASMPRPSYPGYNYGFGLLSIARAILRASRQSLSNRDVLTRIGWPTLAWRRRQYKLFLSVWQLTKALATD